MGGINTAINRMQAIGADGPAYHNAREAIAYVKNDEKKYEAPKRFIYFKVPNNEVPEVLDLLNATPALCNLFEDNWTCREREIIF